MVREPKVEDADALGRVHVQAWQAAYRGGLMPDAYLDGLKAEDRRRRPDVFTHTTGPRSGRGTKTGTSPAIDPSTPPSRRANNR